MKKYSTKEIHNYYMCNDVSLEDIGRKFNISSDAIRYKFLKEKLSSKPQIKIRKKIDLNKLEHLYSQKNYSMNELADYFNCSNGTIWNRICELRINKTRAEAKAKRQKNYTLWTPYFTGYIKGALILLQSLEKTASITGVSINTLKVKNKEWKLISSGKSKFGVITCGLDGIRYRSKLESLVANFLYLNNIQFRYNVRVCKERQWTCDFKIGALWIEVDGLGEYRGRLPGQKDYEDSNEKINYYKTSEFNYLILKPKSWKKTLENLLLCGV